jgi:hypothetical protein
MISAIYGFIFILNNIKEKQNILFSKNLIPFSVGYQQDTVDWFSFTIYKSETNPF